MSDQPETTDKATTDKSVSVLPHRVFRDAIYDVTSATAALGFGETTLLRAIRGNELRASRRGGRYLIMGSWLLDWIAAGATTKARRTTAAAIAG